MKFHLRTNLSAAHLTAACLWLAGACMLSSPAAAQSAIPSPTLPDVSAGLAPKNMPVTAADKSFREGLKLQAKGDVAGAKAQFEAGLREDSKHVQSLIGLASVALMQKQTNDAEKLLERAEASNPSAPEVQMAWARFFAFKRDEAKAEAALRKAKSLAPNALPPLVELGMHFLRVGRPSDGLKEFREAETLDRSNKYVAFGVGMAASALGDRPQAMAAFEKAAKLGPKDAGPLRMVGRLHMQAGDVNKALVAFDGALKRQPKDVPTMLDRADALAQTKRPGPAADQALAAEREASRSPEVLLRVADLLHHAKRWDDAQARYLKVIELAPKHPSAYNNLAWMTVDRKGDPSKAVAWARQAVALAGQSAAMHDTLGWALRSSGDLKAATASLSEAVKLDAKSALYLYHLGVVQAEQKDVAAARKSLQQALEMDLKPAERDEARRLLDGLSK